MTVGLRPYPEYKDSGVEWLGQIPAHWDCLPHRAIFQEIKDQGHVDEPLLSVTISKGLIRQSDLLAGSSKKDSSNLDKSKYKLVVPGDIAYNKMRTWQGAVGVSRHRGIVSPAYIVVRLRNSNNPEYFHFLFRTPGFATEAERWSYGITSDQWSLRHEHFKMIYSCVPRRPEQDAIVAYLRQFEVKVRLFIRNRRRLIGVLNELKRAIINRSVTRGLDPNVTLKPSGIDWLGNIPQNWSVVPLKRACTLVRDGTHLPPPRTANGVPLLSVRNIISGRFVRRDDDSFISNLDYATLCRSFVPKSGDVLLAIVGATMGKVAIVPEMEPFHIQRSLAILRPRPDLLDKEFLAFFLRCPRFQGVLWQTVAFSAQPGIYLGTISAFSVPLPSLLEQREIISTLRSHLTPLLVAEQKAQSEIDLIREYWTRLIADVVTGKLDVRHLAPAPEAAEVEVEPEDLDDEMPGEDEAGLSEEVTDADD